MAVLAGLIVLALLLRFWRLGEWNFQATEIFTLRDSARPQFRNPRPLGYLLNYFLIRPFMPLDELSLRLFPALFGVLAVPSFFFVARRFVSERAALLGTLLLTINPVLISYSQLARYWSLVFCLCTVYPYALYLGVRDGNRKALILGVVLGILAVLAHPVSALAVVGPGLMMVGSLRGERLKALWNQKAVRWGALVAMVLIAVAAYRLVPILHRWIAEHDENPGSGQFLVRPGRAVGVKQIVYLLAFVDGLTLPVALGAVVGLYVLWRERRDLAVFLLWLAAVPIAFLTLISMRTPVSTYYLLPVVPVFLIGAGVFLDRLFEVDWKVRPAWLFPAAIVALVVAFALPTLISDYRNGRRYDFRAAANWLHEKATPGDVAYSDQPVVLTHYLSGMDVERLRYNTEPLQQSLEKVEGGGHGRGALWIVAPGLSHALRTNLKQGGLITWIYGNCQLETTVGNGRVDFRQQYLQVYRCPPTTQ